MNTNIALEKIKGYRTAEARWARFGPYYAMFPMSFAIEVINKYTNIGDSVLDPFAGRGSSLYASKFLNRNACGIEINPVGWLYSMAKNNPALKEKVIDRLKYIYSIRNCQNHVAKEHPEFFHYCFNGDVLKFLLAARKYLDWKSNDIDQTLMAFILDNLHGNIGNSLSNQMQKTKAMGDKYSIQWWKNNSYTQPPEINAFKLLKEKIEWRYKMGVFENNTLINNHLGDSCEVLNGTHMQQDEFDLLLTSPPYFSITNYYADQWIRLWMLGGPNKKTAYENKHKGGFTSKEHYQELLHNVFSLSSKLMKPKSTIYVRTDSRKFTFDSTKSALKENFQDYKMRVVQKPLKKGVNQTIIYNKEANISGEVDIILTRNA